MSLAPEDPRILMLRTRLLQRAGQQEDALRLAQKVTTLAPQWDEPYYLAGVSSYFIRRYDQAEQNLARAIELNPKSPQALFLQSIALGNLGKIDDAERALRQALELQPNSARLHCHLGILLMRRNETLEAQNSFRRSIQLKLTTRFRITNWQSFWSEKNNCSRRLMNSNRPQLMIRV